MFSFFQLELYRNEGILPCAIEYCFDDCLALFAHKREFLGVWINFHEVVDFLMGLCNNSGIVTGNDTAIIALFSEDSICGRKNGR